MLFAAGCFTISEPRTGSGGVDEVYMDRYLNWYIKREMTRNDIAGLSIAIVDDHRVIWTKGFGYANRETGEMAGSDTLYRAGSISKLFTATAVMQLVESKQIDIDQPIVRYVPGFKIKSRFGTTDGITPRNMMSHHSGLPTMYEGDGVRAPDEAFLSLLEKIKDEYVATPPNTVTAYSNLAYSLLGILIENVSGKDFRRYVKENLLQPLSMHSSFFSPDVKNRSIARGYDHNELVAGGFFRLNPRSDLIIASP